MTTAHQARKLITTSRSKTRAQARGFSARDKFDLEKAGQRLGLTQEQLARALNLSARMLRHLEIESGAGQTNKRMRDLRQLFLRMDEYVVVSQENQWLSSPLEIFGGRSPRELIIDGQVLDLIAEFDRLREGQPV